MSWWNAITSVVNDVSEEVVSDVEQGLQVASTNLNTISDTLDDIDETIEEVPVLGTLYDLTPVHTAVHLGSEWSGVGGELAGDVNSEMHGSHADWGHLGNQALNAGVETGIAIAASEIGGAGAGRILGKMGGSAARAGMKTAGRDVAGQVGTKAGINMAERSLGRRGADFVAHTGLSGGIGSAFSTPAMASAHGAGVSWDDRPHLQRENRLGSTPQSSGRLGQGGGEGNLSMRGQGNHSHRTPTGDMGNMDYVFNHASNLPVYNNIPHGVNQPPIELSYREQMSMAKQSSMGNFVPRPPSNTQYAAPPVDSFTSSINPNYSPNTNPQYQTQPYNPQN